MTFRELNGKHIRIHNRAKRDYILTYMELNGVTWNSGLLPTENRIIGGYPFFLNLNDGILTHSPIGSQFVNELNIISINGIIEKLNWYKVLRSKYGIFFLYHILTDKSLILNGENKGLVLNGRQELYPIYKDLTLTSSDMIKLHRKEYELFITYVNSNTCVSISEDGFTSRALPKTVSLDKYGYTEIEKILFKKTDLC